MREIEYRLGGPNKAQLDNSSDDPPEKGSLASFVQALTEGWMEQDRVVRQVSGGKTMQNT